MKKKYKHGSLHAELKETHGTVWHDLVINVDDAGAKHSLVIGIAPHMITLGDIRLSQKAGEAFRKFIETSFKAIDEEVEKAKLAEHLRNEPH